MEKDTTMKGSEILIRSLERAGVDLLFAYPGGQAIELHQALIDSPIRVILPRHEQGGAFAAGGYARATGKVGVCMATSGPGATNLVSGIADAYMDSVPTVFITGQVPSSMIGKNVFQETDIIGMTRMVVKHSYLVLDAADIPMVVKEAMHLARSGRPGPVMIDIPKNVQQQRITPDFDAPMQLHYYHATPKMPAGAVDKIKAMIAESERPCVYYGGGIISAEASGDLRKFIESYNIPAVGTLMGIGALPDEHPLNFAWLGMHGTVYANRAANECDLLLTFGARFDDRVTGNPANFARHAKIVHVDIDDSELNKNKPATFGVIADVKEMLCELNKAPVRKEYAPWFEKIEGWRRDFPRKFEENSAQLQPQHVLRELARITNGEALIVPGVGQHQMFAAQFYTYKFPRQLLTSGGLGAMGFGLPAAMGAKLARPDKLVINIDGDGSFQMNIQELGTLHTEKIGVKCVILNNQVLGMVAQWEDRFYQGRHGNTILGSPHLDRPYPDFVTIARGYAIKGREVYTREELADALREMLADDEPFVLDVHTGYTEHVLPMIPPGKDYQAIITR